MTVIKQGNFINLLRLWPKEGAAACGGPSCQQIRVELGRRACVCPPPRERDCGVWRTTSQPSLRSAFIRPPPKTTCWRELMPAGNRAADHAVVERLVVFAQALDIERNRLAGVAIDRPCHPLGVKTGEVGRVDTIAALVLGLKDQVHHSTALPASHLHHRFPRTGPQDLPAVPGAVRPCGAMPGMTGRCCQSGRPD